VRLEFDAQAQRFEEAKSRLRATADSIQAGRSRRDMLYYSAVARLQARLETMPVIEQAKGIVMAQELCGPDQAFELPRTASQRANVKVHVLAERIVAHLASDGPESDAEPSTPARA
jgi:AmiR/NasT family two-component response regulator